MSTPLAEKIKALVRLNGPIGVTDYFALCLADPQYGYYRTREPFGRAGDFVTAPEISQLFGEMLGIFLVHAWQRHGSPERVRLVEIGPGRGTMSADMLRVIARLAPELYTGLTAHLVETSERLTAVQRQTLQTHGSRVSWHESFEDVPEGFALIVANELFDAIPIRQFVRTATGFRERMVGLGADGELAFTTGPAGIDPALLPPGKEPPHGTVFEVAPARAAVMQTICERLRGYGGTALAIDYGHTVTGYGDTLQAVLKHEYDPPLANPGEADLTSHVDFESLSLTAEACGLQVNGCVPQGDFLLGLGLLERAGALGRGKEEATQHEISIAVDRLAGSGEGRMGELFKVLAVSSPAVELMPFRRTAAST